MKFGIVTFYNERYKVLGDITSRVTHAYCQEYGFDFISSMDESLHEGRTPLWAKIPLLNQNLKNYDWLMWIDSDAMPLNFTIDARDFIDDEYSMVLAEEHHPDGSAINTGILWIKNERDGFKLLEETWKQTQCINHPWGEQQGMIEAIEKNPYLGRIIKKIDIKPINVKPENFEDSDFICHIAGGPANPQAKAQTMLGMIDRIKYKENV